MKKEKMLIQLDGYLRKSIIKSAAQSLEELAEDVKRIGNKIDEFMGGVDNV